MLSQRMLSDTDLWLGLKAQQARYKNVLSTNKELLPVKNKHFNSAVDSHEQEILLPKISGQLKMHDREETNKKLKAINLPFITDLPAETFHRQQQHHKI